jgi:hypothetical protein
MDVEAIGGTHVADGREAGVEGAARVLGGAPGASGERQVSLRLGFGGSAFEGQVDVAVDQAWKDVAA